MLLALVTFATLRMPAALISVAALGLPLLFLMYMRETNVFRDVPRRTLLLTTALGIGLGIGWVLLTGAIVARSYGVPLGAGIAAGRIAREGLGIPVGSMVLMLAPAVVVRLLRPPTRESMDGFMIGALGALAFTAAATLTRLAPQFATGMVARARPVSSLIVEAGIRGVAVPITAACRGRAHRRRAVVHPTAQQDSPARGVLSAPRWRASPRRCWPSTPHWESSTSPTFHR